MAHHGIFMLLEKYPHLRPIIEQGRFLLGYTDGRADAKQVPVFLLRSPWTQFCIWATASDLLIPAGGVLVLTDDPQWSLESHWKAYSLVTPRPHSPLGKNATQRRYRGRQRRENTVSPLTTLAAEIATEAVQKSSSRTREMTSLH
ncbi:hypothetical protein VB715_08785 [Crocosphaera sp. UHCC 0190]|uniref:hypothetical protein n=1 Tax=Crocosphaera sp. UHCC 0190 TaxID=3110246 RepID=UPI002B1FC7E9|nr:hypothetical protein [Crocosphaera sp. UHCC 0190]MEA5509857.1 hypothetical protein [Crocosphaera sp. UHCC 0190]